MSYDIGDEPQYEKPSSRTGRIQHFIAGHMIRPTSVATGEQRNALPKDWNGRLTEESITRSEKAVHDSKKHLPKLKEKIAATSELLDMIKNTPDSPDQDIERVRWQKKTQADLDQDQAYVSRLEKNPTVYTKRHVTMAALLGKKAVNWALSDDNPQMSKWIEHKDLGQVVDKDTGEAQYALSPADVGQDKARHRAETANLPLMERIKARVAPWHANVHEVSDAYGGPHEGGWWYDKGTVVGATRGYMTRRGAEKAAEHLSKQFTKNRQGRSSLSISPSDAYQADYDQGVFDPVEYTDNMAEAEGMPSRFIQEPSDEDFDYSMFGKKSNDYRVNVTRGEMTDYPRIKPHYE